MEQKHQNRKYSNEQYALAELMLTHGYSVRATARVCRMSEGIVMKLSAGDIMHDIVIYNDDDTDNE